MNGNSQSPKPDYGIDAPNEIRQFIVLGSFSVLVGGFIFVFGGRMKLPLINYLALPLIFVGLSFLGTAGLMIWGSRVRKFTLRDQVIESIPWRGDETVLDVGCGNGLVLIAAAKKLENGQAIGLDVLSRGKKAFHNTETIQRNARIEGVSERIEIRSGDARALALPDESVDVVFSCWVLHNIEDQSGRDQAIREVVRVLKPGGRAILMDFSFTQQYAAAFKKSGIEQVEISRPDYLFVVPTYRVQAIKPAAKEETSAIIEENRD
ncbi:MAG TPA: class I SAM-dependent methyltransferase [Anaerolineaceae bacterium]|nr:class I SAM-dependent methyltransferase [Anaerolineaceae bacterium]